MEYQAPSVSIPSSKLSIGPTFSGKSMYDGVFGTPSKFEVPTFSSRVHDYRDIFSGSEASGGLSIPILEVPELNERKILEDVRSSKFDYAEIFGDFGDSDFAEPYEQIFVDPKKNESDPEESSRKPVEKLSTSEVFDTCSEGSHGLPPEAYQKPLNSIKEFNISYHKINNGIQDGSNGTTHIAQLHAVPGYTSVFDEVTPLLVNKVDESLSSDVSDACPSNCLREETVARNHIRETMPDFPKSGTSNGSSSKLPDTHENAHGTSQSEIPTSLSFGNNSGSSERPMAFNFWKTSTDSFDGSNIYSPPSFDEEVDKNSVTAPSVAALRRAIEEAQARIKFAKETKGRKNIGLQHRVKLSFKGDIKDDEEKNGQIELNIFRNKKACELHELDASLYTVGMTKHHLIRPGGPDQVTLDLNPQEKILQAKEVDGETFGKDFKPIHMDHRQEEADMSETEEEFFEVCSTGQEWTTEFKEVKNENKMMHTVVEHECKENGTINEAFEKPEQDANKLKPAEAELAEVEEFFEVSNTGDDWPPETSEFKEAENANNMIDEDKSKEKRNMIVISRKPEQGDREIKPDEEHSNYEGTEKKIRVCDETRAVLYCEEKNSKFTSDEVENRIQVAQGHEETENIEPVHEKDKYEEKSREFQKPMEDDERLETQRIKELELLMEPSATSNCVEKEKEEVEACELERYKKEYKDAHWVENVENNFEERSIPETIEARLHDFHSVDETEKRLGDDSASEGNEKLQQDVSKENVFKGNDYQKKDNDKRQEETGQWVEDGVVETNVDDVAGYEERVKETRDLSHQNEIEATEDLYSHYESGRLNSIQEFTVKIGNQRVMDSSPEVSSCEETKCIKEGTKASLEHNQQEEEGMELVTLEENNEVEEREILESDGLPQGFKLSEILKQMEDTICPFWGKLGINLGGSEKNFEENPKDKNAMEFETVCNSGIYLEESAPELEEKFFISESAVDVHDEDAGLDVKADWLFNVSERKEKNLKREQPMKTVPSTEEYQEEEEESQSEENNEEIQQETDSSQSSEKNEDEFEIFLTSQVMETREEYHQESPTSQSAEPAEVIHQATITAEEIESNDSFQKEMELEEKPLRNTDEANERGRDKEKERMAVERAIREARERAFAEARERAEAERAATQARQRERLGKTTVQSNNKSLSEKASKKAKIKAERAAVERVLAEARERALEKAMSFKAASGARKRAERFVDEKNSGAFSDNGKKSSSPSIDPQNKGSYSSNHNERSDGANGESAPRCKARLERQQRTTERAAKALAEKNMRDLLAQREQAERNRLAEVIDAEVKRWSSGKEGNIRALLSTLQYILGPSSGWQSIPLTDIITTAAVKKAYRRATLFVHPDKLQQRGASIQQKYTCEKVFDLLKDAWSRFNMEER